MKHRAIKLTLFSLLIMAVFIPLIPASAKGALPVKRITHPAYQSSNIFFAARNPWNRDFTRMMLYEETSFTHPDYGTTGRGLIWGNVQSLTSWTTLEEYQAATKLVPDSVHITSQAAAYWSPFEGEENIIYAPFYSGNVGTYIKKINVDTGVRTNVVPINDTPYSTRNFHCYGWNTDNKLICSIAGADKWENGGYEVDVQTGSKSWFEKRPSVPYGGDLKIQSCDQVDERYWTYPAISHGHSGRNPSGTMVAINQGFGNEPGKGIFVKNGCGGNEYFVTDPYSLTGHLSWKASDSWYISNGAGDTAWESAPNIEPMKVYKTYFTPDHANKTATWEYVELVSMVSAGRWESSPGAQDHYNYHAIPISTLSTDGKSVLFYSTNGKYTYDDYKARPDIASDWGTIGSFIIDLTSGEISDNESPTTPAGLTATASSPNLISLTWSPSSDNNAVAGYAIYHNLDSYSSPVATVTGNSYEISGLEESTSYSYRVLAYDTSGNESELSDIATATTLAPAEPSMTILKTSFAPSINGNLSEYEYANSISFSPSSGANTVVVKALWDDDALYLGINVTDSQVNAEVTTRDGSVWNEDSLEWFIDTYFDGGGSSDPDSPYMREDDYQGIVNVLNAKYDAQGTSTGDPTGTWNGSWVSAVSINGTNNANDNNDSGYSIEIKIPWNSIGYTYPPTDESLVGLSFAINDKDATSSAHKMWLNDNASNQNAFNWQKVILSGTETYVDNVPPSPPAGLQLSAL